MASDEYEDDEDLDEVWDDSDEDDDEALPVIPAGQQAPPPPDPAALAESGPAAPIALTRRREPKGNVKAGDAAYARAMNLAEATGRARPEPDDWREQLEAGEKSTATATLSSRRPTHNAGSGFGLA